MTAQWKPVLRAVLAVREHFLRVYPQHPDGRWKLGDLHFLCCGILAVPTLQLMRWRNPVQNGELDPVMSSLFRVTDGVRMVYAYLLDLYERPMRTIIPNLRAGADRRGGAREPVPFHPRRLRGPAGDDRRVRRDADGGQAGGGRRPARAVDGGHSRGARLRAARS